MFAKLAFLVATTLTALAANAQLEGNATVVQATLFSDNQCTKSMVTYPLYLTEGHCTNLPVGTTSERTSVQAYCVDGKPVVTSFSSPDCQGAPVDQTLQGCVGQNKGYYATFTCAEYDKNTLVDFKISNGGCTEAKEIYANQTYLYMMMVPGECKPTPEMKYGYKVVLDEQNKVQFRAYETLDCTESSYLVSMGFPFDQCFAMDSNRWWGYMARRMLLAGKENRIGIYYTNTFEGAELPRASNANCLRSSGLSMAVALLGVLMAVFTHLF